MNFIVAAIRYRAETSKLLSNDVVTYARICTALHASKL
jgi:hypothetical protein